MIYVPKGKAKEYGDYAVNLYNNCPHGCVYCFAPMVLKKDRENFHKGFSWKDKAVERINKWFDKNPEVKDKHIHLCFTCDPCPCEPYDSYLTLQVIDLIHRSGNFVQILTKGKIDEQIVKQLCEFDIVGITVTCGDELAKTVEPRALPPSQRLAQLARIKQEIKCKTFISCEPVFEEEIIYDIIRSHRYIDEIKVGKLNYMAQDNPLYPKIDWCEFGKRCEAIAKVHNRKLYIKESLRDIMKKGGEK